MKKLLLSAIMLSALTAAPLTGLSAQPSHVKVTVSSPRQQNAACQLEVELVLLVVDEVHYERHAETGYSGIDDVAGSRSDAGHETIPAPFVQCTLNAQYAYRSHGRRGNHADKHALEEQVDNVYM